MVLWNRLARMRAIGVALLSVATPIAGGADALAQATPTPTGIEIPAPQECQVAPREGPLFPEGVGQRVPATPEPFTPVPATPFAIPAGEAADAETVAAVTATVREALACRNANEFARAYALFTQEMLIALFGGPATIDPEIRAALEEDLDPLPRRFRVALVGVRNVTELADGRVGAVVETLNAQQVFRDYLIFARDPESGRWLIDEAITLPAEGVELPEAGQATPVP